MKAEPDWRYIKLFITKKDADFMTESLFLEDSYIKECDAVVVSAEGNRVELDRTVFYPQGGGQPADGGMIISGGSEFKVTDVKKEDGKIIHYVDREGLKTGDNVHCILDWERRYKLMKHHTATHILAAVMHKNSGALITGNQLGLDESRIDFSLETFDREKMADYVAAANQEIRRDIPILTFFLPREEAMKIPGIVKLANALPPQIETLRIVEIGDVDIQADGGTHVRKTSEVGRIEVTRLENKGKDRRRIYFKLA